MLASVRARITVVATVVVLVVLAATGAALITAQRSVLTDSVDEVLAQHSRTVARELDAGALDSRSLGQVIPAQGDDEAFAQVVDASGRIVASTARSFDGAELSAPAGGSPRYDIVHFGKEGEYRVRSERHDAVVIVTGTPLDDVNDSVAALTRGLVVAVPAAALLLAALVWVLVGRVLRPVEEIRREVASITGSSLERRVREPGSRDEIARLARTMNEMLERVEFAAERQRRFVEDASHELRTPLARIRAELEVDLAHPDPAGHQATLERILRDADELQRLIDDLLTLARSDDDTQRARWKPVDLDDIVLREATRLRAAGTVSVDVSRVSAAQVLGDADQLARAVRNLLDNAAQHGGSSVEVALGEVGTDAVLAVTDDGAGIPAHLQERVFERFTRVDPARTRASGGSGLGLAITRDLVAAHGGTVTVDAGHTTGARLVVHIPLVRSLAAQTHA
ncbi:MAG: putative sensor histidine kinase TcrY [Cryobacterium sp.]|nr:putative sensor histidine kinase TcrY [Cryobacterium sp.]